MILNYGSLNLDHVYRLPHFVQPGETLASCEYNIFAGGKGANQSMALARAGADVGHAGKLGHDGHWLKQKLADAGVDTAGIDIVDGPSGHAVIQVDDHGENCIILHGGANHSIDAGHIHKTIKRCRAGDLLLLQNELNADATPVIMQQAAENDVGIAFNPAPMTDSVNEYDLGAVQTLIVNEVEAAQLADEHDADADAALAALAQRWPQLEIVLTRGARGACCRWPEGECSVAAPVVDAVDTTAAGDTFIGYFLAARAAGDGMQAALELACAAAALCVTQAGAMDAIPARDDVLAFTEG